MFTKKTEMMLTLLGAKGWANAWPERVIEFIKQFRGKQFVAFCNSFREKPREPSQSQATARFYVCTQFSRARSPNSLEPFERQLFFTLKKVVCVFCICILYFIFTPSYNTLVVQSCLNYVYIIIIIKKRRKLEWRRAHYSKTNLGPLTRLTLFFCSFVIH